MIRVNLLPHREEKRQRRKQQFIVMAGLCATLALVAGGLVWFLLDQQVVQQQANVAYMKDEIGKLDKQIDEIRKIREETQSLLAKKQVVEGLQSNRSEPVQLLDQLLRQLPEGVFLKAVRQTGTKIKVEGYAQSNARVSALMRNLGASPYLENPELVEIKAVTLNQTQRVNEFSMNISIKRNRSEDGKAASKADKKPGAK